MARKHQFMHIINEEGQPVEDASIYVYLADTDIPATLYPMETGGVPFRSHSGTLINNDSIILSDENGYFEFWVDNSSSGYALTQKFKIVWVKLGILSGEVDYVDIFSEIVEVDETSSTTLKNKAVSNLLAKTWSDHAALVAITGTPHDINVVDETSTNTSKNKLVSNLLAKTWDEKPSIYRVNVDTSLWISDGANYYRTVTHNLGQNYVIVDVFITSTGISSTIIGKEVISTNSIKITVSTNDTQDVVVVG